MKKKEERFIQFPLPMMGEILKDLPNTMHSIIGYGVYKHSKRLTANLEDVCRQIIYDLYKNKLDAKLKGMIDSLDCDIIGCNEDYEGFNTLGEFDAVEEIIVMKSYFLKYPDLEESCKEHYRLNQARRFLGVKLYSFDLTIANAKKLENKYSENKIFPMINLSHIWNYLKHPKTEKEIIQLLAFIAIKSIIGNQRCCKINKQHIVARMLGYASIKDIPEKMDSKLAELLKKYSHRYHIDEILKALEREWNVQIYGSNMRGFYVGIRDKISLEEMITLAESNKKKHKDKLLKDKKRSIREKVIQQLK